MRKHSAILCIGVVASVALLLPREPPRRKTR